MTTDDDMSARAPTMRDVAAIAGVSIKTVSRVINDEPGVSSELAERVQAAVKLLGYRHNSAASNLRRADGRTATIGLLLEDAANPLFSALHRAIEDVAWEHDTLVFAGSSDADPEREKKIVLALSSRRIDGIIVVPAIHDHSGLVYMQRLGRPIVFVDRLAALPDADSVTVDNRVGGSTAVAHLVAHGHRRIAFLGDLHSIWTAAERHLGYIEGLASAGIQLDPHLVYQDIRGSVAAEFATLDLLGSANPPTALFTAQNLITIGAIRALQRLELQHKVALVGFDDLELMDLLDPGVTVIAQNAAKLGRTAAELLFARLGGDRAPPQHVVVPTRLIARGSGEIRLSS
ncbi:MAG TPA: LacI family DNA-binding transcriptional regulator [Kouleothrix sp.]|uniref:LacI family DNA-binding transcriptional regulator n=1 Tax=Kouleothrix sp. TaxID=2779161 RepID=UPI002BB62A91|nr:LacI family DNA-binding transcriptional regulator [Kouleothrix sp.]HRC74203.1 LacI family DNA-binding transcriptional regulator [Kouleothrix sp.]